MNTYFVRPLLVCSLALAFGFAAAQRGGGHGGGGGGHSSGGYSGGHSGGYSGGSHSGGYSSHSSSGGGYTGGGHFGGYSGSFGSRYSGSFGSRSGGESSSFSRGQSGAASTSRYSRSSSSTEGRGAGQTGSSFGGRGSSSGDSSFVRSHSTESRSGASNYSGNNNHNASGLTGQGAGHFAAAPRGAFGGSGGRGFGRGGFGGGGWRTGYWGYGGWRDSFFAFPFYCFDPFFGLCYASPWYYYPCLPPYVAASDVIIQDSYPVGDWSGNSYDWDPGYNTTANAQLDGSVSDIIAAFENDDHKALDRIVPHAGTVSIYTDGKFSYSLKANDFYDTYLDGIESTKTDRYQVMDVRVNNNDGTARVTAKHVYNDPWGNRTSVYHSYLLKKEAEGYVIREFGTSDHAG